jgi:Uma2 family endonuclease
VIIKGKGVNNTKIEVMVITTSPLVKTYTLQEFWNLPEPSDHSKLELIKGVLYMTPPPDYSHNQASADLLVQLQRALDKWGYPGQIYTPRTAIWVDDNTYLEPDLIYMSDELKTAMDPNHWTRADIVVEVTSPSTALYDRKTKSDTYQAMGVREMWVVDTETKQIEVRCFENNKSAVFKIGDILRSEVLQKIEIPVASILTTP